VLTLISVNEITVPEKAFRMFYFLEMGFVFCPGSSLIQETTLCYTEYKGQWYMQSNKFRILKEYTIIFPSLLKYVFSAIVLFSQLLWPMCNAYLLRLKR